MNNYLLSNLCIEKNRVFCLEFKIKWYHDKICNKFDSFAILCYFKQVDSTKKEDENEASKQKKILF